MVGIGGAPGRRSPHPSGTHLPLILFPVLCLTLLWPFLWAWVSLFLSFWSDFSGLARVGGQQLLDGVGWVPGVHSPSISGSGGRATVLLTPRIPTWVSELLFVKVSRLCWAGLPNSTQHPASKRAVIALSSPLLLPLLLLSLSLDLLKNSLSFHVSGIWGSHTGFSPPIPLVQSNAFHWNVSFLSGIGKFLWLDLLGGWAPFV